jgi:hypothetical protein
MSPPTLLAPIVVARPGQFPAGVDDAWIASLDDDRALVLAATGRDATGGADVWWTVVDRRRRTVDPWKTLASTIVITQVQPLRGGAVAVAWFQSNTFAFQGDVRVFVGDAWSPALSSTRGTSGPIASVAPLGDRGAIAGWQGGVATLREGFWSPPLVLGDFGSPLIETLADGGAILTQEHGVDVGFVVTPLAVDARGGWSTSGPSPLVATQRRLLGDGTTLVVLFRPRGDGLSQVWSSFAHPPQPWSTPAPVRGADGAPLLVDYSGSGEPMLFRSGARDGELVTWVAPCPGTECDRVPTSVPFVDGAWSTPVDLSWGPGTPFERRHVYAIDPQTPVLVREGAFRARLRDEWKGVAGISEQDWSLRAASADGVWMSIFDPSTSRYHLVFYDLVRHTTARTDLPDDYALVKTLRGFVDASGAFVLQPGPSESADVLRWETPDATPDSLALTLEGETFPSLLPSPVVDLEAHPTSEIFVVHADVTGGARLRVGAWNGAGSASGVIEGGWPIAFRTEWRGCGGALLYGYSDAASSHKASTLLLLPIR